MLTVNLPLKQKHIDKGVPCSCSQCPFALAIMDKFSIKFAIVATYTFSIMPYMGGYQHGAKLSKEISHQIDNYDMDGVMKPGIYQIEIPDEWGYFIIDKTVIQQ